MSHTRMFLRQLAKKFFCSLTQEYLRMARIAEFILINLIIK